MHFFLPNTPPAPPIGTLTSHAAARVAGFVTDDNVTMKVNQCEVLRNPAKWNKLKALGLCQSMVIICSVVNGASSGKKKEEFRLKQHRDAKYRAVYSTIRAIIVVILTKYIELFALYDNV